MTQTKNTSTNAISPRNKKTALFALLLSGSLIGGALAASTTNTATNTTSNTQGAATDSAQLLAMGKGGKDGKGGRDGFRGFRGHHGKGGHDGFRGFRGHRGKGGKGGAQLTDAQRKELQAYKASALSSRIDARSQQIQDTQAKQWLTQAKGLVSSNPRAAASLTRAAETLAFHVPRPELPATLKDKAGDMKVRHAAMFKAHVEILNSKNPPAEAQALIKAAQGFSQDKPRVAHALLKTAKALTMPQDAPRGAKTTE